MSFVIAHLSDPHLGPVPLPQLKDLTLKRAMGFANWKRGRERLNDMAMLDRLVEDLRAQHPDHIAMTGDIVNIALPAEFVPATRWMHQLGDPADVSFTPGNHDAYVRSAVAQLDEAFSPWTSSDSSYRRSARFPFVRRRQDIVVIGLGSGVATAPLMATGYLGASQLEDLAGLLRRFAKDNVARVILIHHPPLEKGQAWPRRLIDAAALAQIVAEYGAELILHGHNHEQMIHSLHSPRAKTPNGQIIVLGAPSASSISHRADQRAAYYLVKLDDHDDFWRVSARARGLLPNSEAIGELPPLHL